MRAPGSVLLAACVAIACAKGEDGSRLFAQDFDPPAAADAFDPGSIIAIEALTDSSVRIETLRSLVATRTSPYRRASFLATYYSNGLSAFDALLNAAEAHHVNPLVLLVRAEMAQGLVGLDLYPADDPARVEYVFRCGCASPTSCDPAYAGFDKQVDCLARQYRIIIDEMDAHGGVTSGGWAKGRDARTLDDQTVTPADDGTAVAYQFEPRLGDRQSGNRLFWTIWKNYVSASRYQPSAAVKSGAWIGDACVSNEQCKNIGPDAICVVSYRGGMCSMPCGASGCPKRDGRPEASCIVVPGGRGNYCFQNCNEAASASCRNGSSEWACCTAEGYGAVQRKVCTSVASAAPGGGGGAACQ